MIGERLRRAREAEGLSQEGVAALLGIQREQVARYEALAVLPVPVERLREFCLVYGVSADSMLGLSECANPDCRRTVETEQARSHCANAMHAA